MQMTSPMQFRWRMFCTAMSFVVFALSMAADSPRPNIALIVADDLG